MNKYEILDVIDEGAYGIVWKAVNKELNYLVAIKEFKEGDEDEFSRKTIQREIRMLKMLKSEYVVGIKEAFKKKGKIYLIFEYFEKNLLNLIEKYQHGLDAKLINSLIYKIIKCLKFLHQKNIIHRDVKPQNILLNSDYSILKICDFGFARFMPEGQYDLTQYVATRWYRSPELLVGQPYGKSADIWAVGCMIGELVDGQPMFPGDDEIDQLYIIKKCIGDLTEEQSMYYNKNSKFSGIELPEIKRVDSIEARYLGKIQKNALNFMKCCLKMDPNERITVEEALKHPYLLQFSIEDNQFSNDEQNLLHTNRKLTILKNQSRASLISVKEYDEEDQKSRVQKIQSTAKQTKFFNNHSTNLKGLKMEGLSLPEKEIYKIQPIDDQKKLQLQILKKKSHTNLQGKSDPKPKQLSPKFKIKKDSTKKLSKMMSQQKNLNVNVDLNLKINLKIAQKLNGNGQQRKPQRTQKAEKRLNLHNQNFNSNKLPQINSKITKHLFNMKYTHEKTSGLISVIGESKELIKGNKITLNH